MNVKKNMLLISGGGAGLLLLAAALAFLFWRINLYHKVSVSLDSAQRELQELYRRDPYPSEKNVQLVQTNLQELSQFQDRLTAQLSAGQIEPQKMQPADFPSFLQEAVRKLNEQIRQQNITVPQRFAYSFDQYAAGRLPVAADIPRLTVQVQSVEALVALLCKAKVAEMVSIERQVFDQMSPAGNRPGESPFAGAPLLRHQNLPEAMAGGAEGQRRAYPLEPPEAAGLYTREHFQLVFRAKDEVLWTLLNALARGDTSGAEGRRWFAVITEVQLDSEATLAKAAPAAERAPPSSALPAGAKPPEGEAAAAAVRPHDERIVAGLEMSKVQLGVDLYRFAGDTKEKTRP